MKEFNQLTSHFRYMNRKQWQPQMPTLVDRHRPTPEGAQRYQNEYAAKMQAKLKEWGLQ